MQREAGRLFFPVTEHVVPGPNTSFPPESTAESVSMGRRAGDHGDLPPGGELLDAMNFDTNSWDSTALESFANMMQAESSVDAVIQLLMEYIDQPNENHTNNNPTNPTPTFALDASSSSQLPSSEASSTRDDTVPTILSEHQSYSCSWPRQGSEAECDHVAPDRSAFLRHLGDTHQVSGVSDETIICRLLESKTGSACRKPIKRGNFPRHVDTHYSLRYQCQYCPAGKSFSRQDSWKKHIRTVHAQTAPTS